MRRALPLAAVMVVAAALAAGPASGPASSQTADQGGDYFSLTPDRLVDTRTGTGGFTTLGPGQAIDVPVTGRAGVPAANVTAVVLNATVTNTTSAGFLTLHPSGTELPVASNLNWEAGQTVPNLVTVKVGTGGRVRVFNSAGSTDVILDVSGWYSDGTVAGGAALIPTEPGRLYDSRDQNDPIGANQAKVFLFSAPTVAGSATALFFNATVTGPQAAGFVTMGPGDPSQGALIPVASNLNFGPGQTVANAVIARKDSAGKIFAFSNARTHIILDQVGRFVPTSGGTTGRFVALPPARILDTREGIGRGRGFLPAAVPVPVTVTGVGGVPTTGVSAVLLNVTVTQPVTPGYLAIWPAGLTQPLVSSINFAAGQTVANLVLSAVGANGQVLVYNQSAATHAIFDVVGWYRA